MLFYWKIHKHKIIHKTQVERKDANNNDEDNGTQENRENCKEIPVKKIE